MKINQTLNITRPFLLSQFLLAFANLDRGLNENNNNSQKHFETAIVLFNKVIASAGLLQNSPILAASNTLLGWTLSESNQHEEAILTIKKGKYFFENSIYHYRKLIAICQ